MISLREKFNNIRLILASSSPRRQLLLKELGLDFEVMDTAGVEESYPSHLTSSEIPLYLAEKKAGALDNLLDNNTVIITADTIVWHEGRVMDKPSGREEAVSILSELSGNRHQVISGVCVKSRERCVSFYSVTSVCFRQLDPEEIAWYVENFQPYDKAGAYGIQEWIGYIGIEAIEGSYFNVMGLPVDKLYRVLVEF